LGVAKLNLSVTTNGLAETKGSATLTASFWGTNMKPGLFSSLRRHCHVPSMILRSCAGPFAKFHLKFRGASTEETRTFSFGIADVVGNVEVWGTGAGERNASHSPPATAAPS